MSTPLEIQKEQRLRLLRRLYEHTGGDTAAMISMWAIGRELGLSEEETRRVVQYLVDENLAKYRAIGGWIGITHRGVKEVEAALQEPGQPTHHFPAAVPAAINVLVIEENINSPIQQGSPGAHQEVNIGPAQLEAIRSLLGRLEEELPNLAITDESRAEVGAHMETVRAQLKSPRPMLAVIKPALVAIRNILQVAAHAGVAAKHLPELIDLIRSLR